MAAEEISVFEHPKPELSEREVAGFLYRDYGLGGALSPLVSERDQNFLLDAGDRKYVVKIANAAEDPEFLELQNSVLGHIASVDPGLGVPVVVPALDGRKVVEWVRASGSNLARVLSHIDGSQLSEVERTQGTLASLGRFMGRLSASLKGFGHPASHRADFLWNLDGFLALKPWSVDIESDIDRQLVEQIFARYEARVLPRLRTLRAGALHQDANDNNLIVGPSREVAGIIDFGDLVFGRVINELAVTLAYALMDVEDIYVASRAVISGYASVFPLEPEEAEVLFDLVAARLAASVCISSRRARDFPDNEYLLISQAPALRLLGILDATNPAFLAAFARDAAGLPAVAGHGTVTAWLGSDECRPARLFDFSLDRSPRLLLSMGAGSPGVELAAEPAAHWEWIEGRMRETGARFAIGLYGEDRAVYSGGQYGTPGSSERRIRHLGIDIFVPAGTPLHAPLRGVVLSAVDNAVPCDYGPTVILEHRAGEDGPPFWTLYGHLSRETLELVRPGMTVEAGSLIGSIGDPSVNGGWAPHLHFQLITDLLGENSNFAGAGQPGLWSVWSRISPDPNLVLRLAPESFVEDPNPPEKLLARRAKVLGPSLSISYRKKLKIVRGRGAWLYDHSGRAYLDGVNNICHVGHSHPRVVEALSRQAAVLNTNTRYLHDTIIEYAERLGAKFPSPLRVVYLVCSGSEANELALRMARTVTGRRHTICLDWGYHGNTSGLIDVSPYKFNRKGGRGKPDYVEIATLPDSFRGEFKGYGEDAGRAYAESVAEKIEAIRSATGSGPAAFITEAISGCGGQVVFPEGYLKAAAHHVRAAGGLVIVDEVQTGFGRVGSHFWAFELQDFVPDIVTLGKPIGNGHPMAAVVTTPEIAGAFANGMEFFSSFGGNPVSTAVGMAVLDVIEDEGLQAKALAAGNHLKSRLALLAERHPLIGDVRGEGLFLGVELVRDRTTLEPATEEAGEIINFMRDDGVMLSTDGPFDNVLKIKPPMAFGVEEAGILAGSLERALDSLAPAQINGW